MRVRLTFWDYWNSSLHSVCSNDLHYPEMVLKYMLCWSIPTQNYNAALDAFLEGGAPMPEGLTALGRWHAPGSTRGWLLCETDNLVALAHHVAEWSPLLKIDVTPVTDDSEAGEAAARVRGQ